MEDADRPLLSDNILKESGRLRYAIVVLTAFWKKVEDRDGPLLS